MSFIKNELSEFPLLDVIASISYTAVQIFWIILIVIGLLSIKRIVAEKGWSLKNFIRVEEVDDET